MNKKIKYILDSINPMLSIEGRDAERWHKLCEEKLIEAYADYEESVIRLKKIKKRLKNLEE